jgi:outer membrane protein OmpA-like peptidoglycan-associated protein
MLKNGLSAIFVLLIICVANLAKSQQLTTQNFYFDTDSSKLSVNEKQKLIYFLKTLDNLTINYVSILGYTDDIGRIGYNDTLSVKRANHIKNSLIIASIDPKIIKITLGKGKIPLANQESITQQRLRNRKVEITIDYTLKPKIAQTLNIDTLKVGDKVVLENILFEASRHAFLPESYETLNMLTKTLKEKTKYNIAILGHICCTPPGRDIKDFDTGEYNLSYARAMVVYQYLIKNGINANRLSFKGMMGNFPLGKGDKSDRRVELQVTSILP